MRRVLMKFRHNGRYVCYMGLITGLSDVPDTDEQCCLYVRIEHQAGLRELGFKIIRQDDEEYLYYPIDGCNPTAIRRMITKDWLPFIHHLRIGYVIIKKR